MKKSQDLLPIPDHERLAQIRRGIEREGLRISPSGRLALTPHPLSLGSALTHPQITTDYSESQIELITGADLSVQECFAELLQVHQYVLRSLQSAGGEMLWASSMPCALPVDETIALARYGVSNWGRSKSVYRMGLGHRYGRRMQMISGVHYNWSMPGLDSAQYFALIRNFRRQAFVLLYLFGASPALCASFVQGRAHSLQPFNDSARTLYLPHATTLRMGRLGYQSDAQAQINVSYNGLDGYADTLHKALTHPYAPYEQLGICSPGGDYNQLATGLLQIENEFYASIRPKRSVQNGERPLRALRARGVEYVEVRLMDLDPFEPVGIAPSTMRMLDIFLLHCLLNDSPPDTPQEIAELTHNLQLTAERGREPGLLLQRAGRAVLLCDWADEILAQCAPLATALDQAYGSLEYGLALAQARARIAQPQTTPSARVLSSIAENDNSFSAFAHAQSERARDHLLSLQWTPAQQARAQAQAEQSLHAQLACEAADTLPFEEWRKRYMAEQMLGPISRP